MDHHKIAILCKSCNNKWLLAIPLSGNRVEVFATICDCGTLIVGNYDAALDSARYIYNKNEMGYQNKIYLTNGHFEILKLSENDIEKLPSLSLE